LRVESRNTTADAPCVVVESERLELLRLVLSVSESVRAPSTPFPSPSPHAASNGVPASATPAALAAAVRKNRRRSHPWSFAVPEE
jgi:hypothetical protein